MFIISHHFLQVTSDSHNQALNTHIWWHKDWGLRCLKIVQSQSTLTIGFHPEHKYFITDWGTKFILSISKTNISNVFLLFSLWTQNLMGKTSYCLATFGKWLNKTPLHCLGYSEICIDSKSSVRFILRLFFMTPKGQNLWRYVPELQITN